jgi:ABC-type nitrate/sulfonate/bicarbonate transport system permease component
LTGRRRNAKSFLSPNGECLNVEIIGGLRITLASAWGLEVFAEILGAPSGIGQAIKALTNLSNVSGLLACVVIVAVTAIVSDILLVALARRVAAWA